MNKKYIFYNKKCILQSIKVLFMKIKTLKITLSNFLCINIHKRIFEKLIYIVNLYKSQKNKEK